MSLLAPPKIHNRRTLPIAPPINILNTLPIDPMSINAILWDMLTREMPPITIPQDNHHFHPPIKPTTSTKLQDLTFQAKTTIKVTLFKIML